MTQQNAIKQRGFTLLELMVSSVIIVFLGLTGFQALKTAMAIREDVTTRHVILREFELTTEIIRRDFNQIQRYPLPKKQNENTVSQVINVNASDKVLLSFYLTANPILRQPMRRVEYVHDNNTLIRRIVSTNTPSTKETLSHSTILLTDVTDVRAEAVFPDKQLLNLHVNFAIMPETVTLFFTHPRYGKLSLKHAFL